ncbi:hypothetical protein AB6A40_005041 [Gnathostoma spinigerum]|uniref:Uncharacterized protein n=1 Tax=Gnathostoma spinigerum TaxID=75299 RepID=A0ABD6ENT5_9BILA
MFTYCSSISLILCVIVTASFCSAACRHLSSGGECLDDQIMQNNQPIEKHKREAAFMPTIHTTSKIHIPPMNKEELILSNSLEPTLFSAKSSPSTLSDTLSSLVTSPQITSSKTNPPQLSLALINPPELSPVNPTPLTSIHVNQASPFSDHPRQFAVRLSSSQNTVAKDGQLPSETPGLKVAAIQKGPLVPKTIKLIIPQSAIGSKAADTISKMAIDQRVHFITQPNSEREFLVPSRDRSERINVKRARRFFCELVTRPLGRSDLCKSKS